MTRTTPLLYQRGLYLALGGLVVFLYGVVWLRKVEQPPRSTSETVSSAPDAAPSMAFDVDSAKLLEALQRKRGVARALNLWTLLVVLLLGSGVVLSIQALRGRRWSSFFQYRSHLRSPWSLSDVGRLLLLVVLMAGLLPFIHMGIMVWLPTWWTQTHLWSVVSMFLLEGWVVLLVWGFASSKGRSLASTVGLSIRHSVRATEQAMASYITCFPWLMGLLWLIMVVCERFGIRPPLEPIHELLFLDQPPLVLGLTVALACVVGPVVEEIFFRGVLFTALRKRTSRLVAMAISGSAFAAAHTNPVGFLPILLLGGLLADCYERTGSLWASIVVHIFHNSLLIGVALTLKALLS